MYIDEIEIHRVAMPLVYPFRTSFADTTVVESVLVSMSSQGVKGWGEAAPWSTSQFSAEWAAGVFLQLRDCFAPLLVKQNVESGDALQEKLSPFKGNFFAKAALDLAWWDLQARLTETSLWKLIGGQSDTSVVGADFGVMENLEVLLETIQTAVVQGYRRVKLKARPGWDLEMVRAVREKFPALPIHLDFNSGYTLDDLQLFQQLDDFELSMFEQPLAHDDLIDHATLQAKIKTPICLDESITSVQKALKAIQTKACRWINVKPGRVGGLTPARQIIYLAQARNIPCWIGGMLESAVGAAHCLALATLPNIEYPSDIFPTSRFYKRDLANKELALAAPSQIKAFSGTGIGVEPEPKRLAALTLESAQIPPT